MSVTVCMKENCKAKKEVLSEDDTRLNREVRFLISLTIDAEKQK